MTFELPEKNLGGYLPNPPKDCERKKYVLSYNGILWLDLSICHACSFVKVCPDRKGYLEALKKKREEHFASLNQPKRSKKDD